MIRRPKLKFHVSLVLAVAVVALAASIAVPVVIDDNYLLRLMTNMLLFAALGQAWNVIGGLGNQASLGHAAYFGIGAYSGALLYVNFDITPWLGMIVGAFLACALAALISVPTFRLKGPYFALGTLAVGEIIRLIALQWRSLTGGSVGVSIRYSGDSWWYLQFRDPVPYYYLFLGALVVVTLVFYLIKRSRLGFYLQAVRHDEDAAQSVGVNVFRSKLFASMLSAALTAMLGTLYAQHVFFIDPASVFGLIPISVTMALIAIVGGLGYASGPMIGAVVFFIIQELGGSLAGDRPGVSEFIIGVVLIVTILAAPRGIVGFGSKTLEQLKSKAPKERAAIDSA